MSIFPTDQYPNSVLCHREEESSVNSTMYMEPRMTKIILKNKTGDFTNGKKYL